MSGKDKLIPYGDRPSSIQSRTDLLLKTYKANISASGITPLQVMMTVNTVLHIVQIN